MRPKSGSWRSAALALNRSTVASRATGIDPDLLGELADGVGLDHPVGVGLAGEQRQDALGVADRLVEDLEAGAGVGELDGVGVVDPERLREVVVGQGLVGEAVALLVHHHRRRRTTAPLELGDGPTVAGDLGVEHHRGAPVRRHVAELGLGVDRHHQPVAGVAAGAEGEDLVAEVGLHQRRVPLEATARQHHALAGTDAGADALVLDDDADHVAGVVGDDLLGRGLEQRLDAPLEQALEQPGDERGALGADVLLLAALQLGLELRALGQEVLGEGGGRAQRHERAALDDAVLPLRELVAHRVGVGLDRAAGLHLRAGEAPRPVVVGQRLDVGATAGCCPRGSAAPRARCRCRPRAARGRARCRRTPGARRRGPPPWSPPRPRPSSRGCPAATRRRPTRRWCRRAWAASRRSAPRPHRRGPGWPRSAPRLRSRR